ncbi:DNA ligase D [Hyphomicrobium sp. xq]|uniref:DNA ligase (ATP) n=1 Tax=Hyphomicrobium album TaxID=2665159 RepID=A0A6I3KP86_9HYPH|nr:DNA ligase D [Hyphomicrobium album]MTD95592.1 DNA ligase D [Hyphomicrobium album]
MSARSTDPLPAFVAPQLASLVAEPPAGKDWLHEIKYDGYRAIAAIGGGRGRIYTRSGQDWTDKFAGIAAELTKLKIGSALLDGEIVVLDEHGRSSFQRLQNALKEGRTPLIYYVFDILEFDGHDLRQEPLSQRKKVLRKVLKGAPEAIRYSEEIAGQGDKVLAQACRLGLEGIVSKQADKPYVSRRSHSWLKSKCLGNEEFVIGGYRVSDKKGRPFASLLLGEFVGDELHYRGRVGTGFDTATLDDLGARFAKLRRKTSPFVDAPREISRDAHWIEPRLVAQIAFTERTTDGILRHPAYLGLRGDKPAREVQAQEVITMSENDDVGGVKLSNPERVLFSEAALTKLDLAQYLLAASERMLPYVRRRPLSLVRCPEGVAKQCFFQKHIKKGMPEALKSVDVKEGDGEIAQYLMIDDTAGLVSVAQIGGVEIHLWGSTAKKLERPDRLIFDLDPDPTVDFAAVRDAARDVRDLLQTAGLTSFPLVTGGKGIHVVVPLDASQDWDTVKSFARGVATKLADTEPERFVATMAKVKRKGRIFIDWLRNERGATAVAPYSPRAKAEASVATPVGWSELSRIEGANVFTIPIVLQRLKRKTDPWSDYSSVRQCISRDALRFFA